MMDFLFTKTPLSFFVQSFWRDEAFAYLLAKQNVLDILTLSARDFSPPVYSLFLHFWIQLFGSSEIALRSLSLIAFFVAFYFFHLFLKDIFKVKKPWEILYLSLFLLNPFLNYYAFEARAYSLFLALSLMSFYFFFKRKTTAYIIVTTIGLYTHYFMIFVVLSQLLYFAITSSKKITQVLQQKFAVMPLILFLPWVLFLFSTHSLFSEQFWLAKPRFETFLNLPLILYTGYEHDFASYGNLFFFLILLFILVIYGIVKLPQSEKSRKDLFLFIFTWTFFPTLLVLLVSFIKPIFFPRYLIFAGAGILLLLILVIEHMNKLWKVVALSLLFLLTINYNMLQIKNRKKAPYREVIRKIKLQTKSTDLLYVVSELDFHTAQYYFGEERVYIYHKSYDEIPSYVGKALIPKERIATLLPIYPRRAFILKPDQTYEIQAIF